MAVNHGGMVNTLINDVSVIRKRARASLPLQLRTRAAPTPKVVGATAKTARPAPNSGGWKLMDVMANPRVGVMAMMVTMPKRIPTQCFFAALKSAVLRVRPEMKKTMMMLIISTRRKGPAVTETTALPGAGARRATSRATRKFRGSHHFLTKAHVFDSACNSVVLNVRFGVASCSRVALVATAGVAILRCEAAIQLVQIISGVCLDW